MPELKEPVSRDRIKVAEETVQSVLYEIEDAKGNVVRFRVKFSDGAIYDVGDSDR